MLATANHRIAVICGLATSMCLLYSVVQSVFLGQSVMLGRLDKYGVIAAVAAASCLSYGGREALRRTALSVVSSIVFSAVAIFIWITHLTPDAYTNQCLATVPFAGAVLMCARQIPWLFVVPSGTSRDPEEHLPEFLRRSTRRTRVPDRFTYGHVPTN